MAGLAYEHLNLRFNPFGELDTGLAARVAVVPPLEVPVGEVVQVLGDAGRGKTTHLLAWHEREPASGYEYIPEGSDRLQARFLPAKFFVDEAQRLRAADLARLFSEVEHLVLATHADLANRTRRPVRSLEASSFDPSRLAEIVSRRVEAARRAAGPIPVFTPTAVARLLERFGSDLRSMFDYLYERFQELEAVSSVEV